MVTSEDYKKSLEVLTNQLIDTIVLSIRMAGAKVVELKPEIVYNYIDDQFSEMVGDVNAETKTAGIYYDGDGGINEIGLSELTFGNLVLVLEAIENGYFTIIEEWPVE